MDIKEVEKYVNIVIPNIEGQLADETKTPEELLEIYNLYVEVLRLIAPYNFQTYNKYLELDENHNDPTKAFYHHRKDHLEELFTAFNDMEVYDAYDMLLISLPPRIGKTTSGIRFLAWIIGKYPEHTQLATSYSDAITTSFYIGVMEIIQSERHKKVFPESPLVSQNAKREEIWLKVAKRYPSITFAPINGSMTGRCEASKYLYCDDLVSGIEEAMSVTRLEKLWQLYTVNAKQRKKEGCKEIHVATRWSVHDPITRLSIEQADNPRCKVITIPCFDENGESRFDYTGGFSTEFYRDLQATMDSITFDALYQCDPIEREGILYNKEDLQYYFTLPDEAPDTIIGICDSKNLGKDFVSGQVGYVYGDMIYIEDVVFNNGLPEVTRPLIADLFVRNNTVRADIELNNGGNFYAEKVQELVTQKGGKTSIRIFFSGNNKQTKIITYSDFVKKHFLFKDPSTYAPNSEYASFMRHLTTWTQRGKNKFDDGVDSIAMLAQLFQDLSGISIKILNRKALGL